MESSYRAGGMPAPAHFHPLQDEHFEVLSGAVRATVDGEARILEEGDTLDLPAGTVHDFGGDPERDGDGPLEVRPALNTAEFFEMTFGLASGEVELPEGGAEELLARFEGEFRPWPVSAGALSSELPQVEARQRAVGAPRPREAFQAAPATAAFEGRMRVPRRAGCRGRRRAARRAGPGGTSGTCRRSTGPGP